MLNASHESKTTDILSYSKQNKAQHDCMPFMGLHASAKDTRQKGIICAKAGMHQQNLPLGYDRQL